MSEHTTEGSAATPTVNTPVNTKLLNMSRENFSQLKALSLLDCSKDTPLNEVIAKISELTGMLPILIRRKFTADEMDMPFKSNWKKNAKFFLKILSIRRTHMNCPQRLENYAKQTNVTELIEKMNALRTTDHSAFMFVLAQTRELASFNDDSRSQASSQSSRSSRSSRSFRKRKGKGNGNGKGKGNGNGNGKGKPY
jgi:hypothetical protein